MNPWIIDRKKRRTLAIIFIVTFALVVLVDFLVNPSPPKILFVDRDKDVALEGKVYLNKQFLGLATEIGFDQLPDEFCSGNNDIVFDTDGNRYSWPVSPEDCKLNFVAFIIQKSQTVADSVIMRFFIKETKEPLTGKLHFNGEFIIDLDGEITISNKRCKTIQNINLTSARFSAEWLHHTRWCDAYAVIEYSVPEADLKQSDFGSVLGIIADTAQQDINTNTT